MKIFFMFRRLVIVCIAMFAFASSAQTFQSGVYQMGGDGFLTIEPATGNGLQSFTISISGANAHLCELDGSIFKSIAKLNPEAKTETEKCDVSFKMIKRGQIEVSRSDQHDGCREYCGARAWFTGLYQIPPEACGHKQVIKTQQLFNSQYNRKDYSNAARTLEKIHLTCQDWIDFRYQIDIRNDLAVTYSHTSQHKECINILAPFTELGIDRQGKVKQSSGEVDNDEEISMELAYGQPAYFDWAREAVNAARTNLKRCGYKFQRAKK